MMNWRTPLERLRSCSVISCGHVFLKCYIEVKQRRKQRHPRVQTSNLCTDKNKSGDTGYEYFEDPISFIRHAVKDISEEKRVAVCDVKVI
jgi:hypothetical protein